MQADESFREIRCAACGVVFHLCPRDDRGQWYCSGTCSRAARRRTCREAQRRYQQSRWGRRTHAANQADHRARTKVTDQGPQELALSGSLCAESAPPAAMDAAHASAARSLPDAKTPFDHQTVVADDSAAAQLAGWRNAARGAASTDGGTPEGSGDAARGDVPVAGQAAVRCAVCGRPRAVHPLWVSATNSVSARRPSTTRSRSSIGAGAPAA
jgi:hypothetical protein